MSDFSLAGKVAVVTGASRGIGRAIALRLAEAGAKVVVSSRKQPGVQAVADEIVAAGGDALAAAFARGCGPISAAAVMGLLLGLTVTYFNFLPWEQVGISGAIIVSAIAAGLLCCRLDGGLTRRALLAANILTQIATLLACLAGRNLLYW